MSIGGHLPPRCAHALSWRLPSWLSHREAVAYALYMMTNTFLAAAVVAAVLFYGGTLVLRGAMSAGSLVSFMLFQQSLSAAFQVGGQGLLTPGCTSTTVLCYGGVYDTLTAGYLSLPPPRYTTLPLPCTPPPDRHWATCSARCRQRWEPQIRWWS